MQLLVWNIRNGGGSRIPRIVEEVAAHDADAVALGGYRSGTGKELRRELRERGWPFFESSRPGEGENGVAVFSRSPIVCAENTAAPSGMSARWLDVRFPDFDFHLAVLQIMAAVGSPRGPVALAKIRLWNAVLAAAEARRAEPWLFAGSWNTGSHGRDERGKTFIGNRQFDRLREEGWTDLWRDFHPDTTEWTWYSNQGNGFRVDHAFASPALRDRVTGCRYSHVERQAKVSDHSLILVDLD